MVDHLYSLLRTDEKYTHLVHIFELLSTNIYSLPYSQPVLQLYNYYDLKSHNKITNCDSKFCCCSSPTYLSQNFLQKFRSEKNILGTRSPESVTFSTSPIALYIAEAVVDIVLDHICTMAE